MAMLKFCFYLLVMLVFIVTGLVFCFRNQSLVSVDFLFYQSAPLSIGFWVLSALIMGVVLGILLAYPQKIFQNLRIKYLSKQVSKSGALSPQVKTDSAKGI